MNKYKISSKHNLVIIKSDRIESDTHFCDLFEEILSDTRYDDEYNFLFDGRFIDWKNVNTNDIKKSINLIKQKKINVSHCMCVVINIGQMAYMDAFLLSTEKFTVEYFCTLAQAADYLHIPPRTVSI